MADSVEYRYPMGGGAEGLFVFDGRVVEFFNLYEGGSRRFPFPETRVERSEPNRKGRVEFRFFSAAGNLMAEFPVEAEAVPGFDQFLANVPNALRA